MRRRGCEILALMLLSAGAAADDSRAVSPIGVGMMAGADESERTFAAVLEGEKRFSQRVSGAPQYGFAQARLELGNHVGAGVSALSGITLFGDRNSAMIAPHVGIEPFSFEGAWNTSAERQSFYDWLPMASFGLRSQIASCHGLAMGRAGGAVGNLGKTGFWPDARVAYGGAVLLGCDKFDLDFELTQVRRSEPIDLMAIDFSIPFGSANSWVLSVRAETLGYGPASGNLASATLASAEGGERRMMVVFRGTALNPF